MQLLRNESGRLTSEANHVAGETVSAVRHIYNELRKQNWSQEAAFYLITTAAHEVVLEEALFPKKNT